ncbi:hypothetical protein HA466_0063330 [Hirschfeldia incana]|nr:hypothetical protein HA466_0063330 [Hirschfeldia incana]
MALETNYQILVEEKPTVRILTLNRPKQLNALSLNMVTRLLQVFLAYEEDPTVKLIILKGQGRAFCAGGDVSAVVRDIGLGKWRHSADFMSLEYTLNYVMATYCKAQISILNGIVMGGGAGVCVHGRFRIATENTVFAIPETALGLFPDVGASYFLSRLPGFFGEYAGLIGARLNGAEMLACGLATHFVPSMGCRAILIDKDRNPKWEPRRLDDMKDSMVEQYFKRVEDEDGWEDLKLPPRKHLPASAIAKL